MAKYVPFYNFQFQAVDAIVGRDVVLTPKHGLELNGKSIFYEEESSTTVAQNQSLLRPWERTLKHVTYATLFANDSADAAAGNVSKQNAYSDFLNSPYQPLNRVFDTRFGDIITLASGRLVKIGNNSYRFIEGECGYDCDGDHVWALWQVQKIRHRDANRKFRYEMKFSVSPLRAESVGNVKRKAESDSNNSKGSALQTYIQRDDDYPHTFGKIVYNDYSRFADRRLDDVAGRNLKIAPTNQHRPATPMPQPTFLHSIFQPPPQFPSPEKLNIGEYIKNYPIKAPPKLEVFPNLLNIVSRNYYPTPTTYRPNYQTKFPRPELYSPTLEHETIKFPLNSRESNLSGGVGKLSTPVVTHHFHHHFYMPSATSIENDPSSAEKPLNKPTKSYKNVVSETTAPTFFNNYYNTGMKNIFQQGLQAVNPISFPKTETQVRKEHVVQVTPVVPLKRPHIYQIPIDSKVPLLIYPAPVVEDEQPLPRNKPFIQSEPMDEDPIRYSEPDPLYLSLAHNPPLDGQSYELGAVQLESPKINQYTEYADIHISAVDSRKVAKPNSIAEQLPAPDNDQDERILYEDESQEASKLKIDLEQKPSQKDLQISFKNKQIDPNTETQTTSSTTESLIVAASSTPSATTSTTTLSPSRTELFTTTTTQLEPFNTTSPSLLTTALHTTNLLLSATTAMPSTTFIDDATIPTKHSTQNFISTSTSEMPSLRAISRYRLKRPFTTSTEQPVLKWEPRRKHSFINNDVKTNSETKPANTNSSKVEKKRELKEQNQRHENQLSTGTGNNSTEAANNIRLAKKSSEVIEVLTQKSVSKSVSIKVGSNGEEIPVIVDDSDHDENEVKTD
ncbi:uncharacterized protein [Bactrocera oleae]|uniref:uncharacterized protein n=1 Tax=Bactrocera oleae TaxID=104688 RepID=UPI00387E8992